MKPNTFCFFNTKTGELHSRKIVAIDKSVALENIPEGHTVIEGNLDRFSQRIDVATGKVIDYQLPQPSMDHEWNATTKRWQLTAIANLAKSQGIIARQRIVELERLQLRALREHALGDAQAFNRLKIIDDEIVRLRKKLQ